MKWKPKGEWSFAYWAIVLMAFAIFDFIIAGIDLYAALHVSWWYILLSVFDAACGFFMLYLLISRFNDR